ncbi:hypothetical protein M5689_001156 [Euphorbia peplus]|nr:hypothetical protein M5689_001156 [Euphorbia peplus]
MTSHKLLSLFLAFALALSNVDFSMASRSLLQTNPMPTMPSLPSLLKPPGATPPQIPDLTKIIPDLIKLIQDLSKLASTDMQKLPQDLAAIGPDFAKLMKDLPKPKLPTALPQAGMPTLPATMN